MFCLLECYVNLRSLRSISTALVDGEVLDVGTLVQETKFRRVGARLTCELHIVGIHRSYVVAPAATTIGNLNGNQELL